jgi:hypothetical protein
VILWRPGLPVESELAWQGSEMALKSYEEKHVAGSIRFFAHLCILQAILSTLFVTTSIGLIHLQGAGLNLQFFCGKLISKKRMYINQKNS